MFLQELKEIIQEEFLNHVFEGKEEEDIKEILKDSCILTFSTDNVKLGPDIATFSLPAGWTCPYAKDCLMKVSRERERDPETGKIKYEKGEDIKYMCYAAWMEMQYEAKQKNNWHNYDLLEEAKTLQEKVDLIEKSIKHLLREKPRVNKIRIHESGDFYTGEYFDAWLQVAKRNPHIEFYAYTKAFPFVKKYEEELKKTPNFIITLSGGGKKDELSKDIDLKKATVYITPEEALEAGAIIDLDDSLAQDLDGGDFGLLVHGMQTKEVGTPDITKHKKRNEIFMKYHKYKDWLKKTLKKEKDYKFTNEEAKNYIEAINKSIEAGKGKGQLKFLKQLMNNIIRYNNYNFDENLLNILPEKYR